MTGLRTFFAATAQQSKAATVGGQGYSLRIQVTAQSYDWDFGDGTTGSGPGRAPSSADIQAGGGTPTGGDDGAVTDTYNGAGPETTTVTVAYGATYSVLVGTDVIGPLPVTGGAVRTLPASTTFDVREAYAGITR